MARVKRGVTSHAKHKKVYKATKGHYGRRRNTIRIAKQSMEKAMQYAYRDRKTKKRTLPRALDPAHQRRGAAVRPELLEVHRRARQGRRAGRPQGAFGACDHGAGGIPDDRREGQGGAAQGSLRADLSAYCFAFAVAPNFAACATVLCA